MGSSCFSAKHETEISLLWHLSSTLLLDRQYQNMQAHPILQEHTSEVGMTM